MSPDVVGSIGGPANGGPLGTTARNLVLRFPADSAVVAQMKPGNILVTGISQLTPLGMIRKVDSISIKPNVALVSTSLAKLTDVVSAGALAFRQQLSPSQLVQGPQPRRSFRGHVSPPQPSGSFCASPSRLQFGSSGQSLSVFGNICVTATSALQVLFRKGAAPLVSLRNTGTDNVNLTWNHQGGAFQAQGEQPVQEFDLQPVQLLIGAVPVVVQPRILMSLDADAQSSESFSGGISHAGSFAASLCSSPDVCPSAATRTSTFESVAPSGGGDQQANVTAHEQLVLAITGLNGPSISTTQSGIASSAAVAGPCYRLDGGFTGTMVLGDLGSPTYPFVNDQQQVDLVDGPCANASYSVSLMANATQAAVGAGVTLTAALVGGGAPSGYHLRIDDLTTGSEVGHGDSASPLVLSVHFDTPATHRFQAVLTDPSGAEVAHSPVVTVTWGSRQVTLQARTLSGGTFTGDKVPVGTTVQLPADVSPPLDGTNHVLKILNLSGSDGAKDCGAATPCQETLAPTQAEKGTFQAVVYDGSNVIAESDQTTVEWVDVAFAGVLSASTQSPAPDTAVTLHVGTNIDLKDSGYSIAISESGIAPAGNPCTSGATCDVPVTHHQGKYTYTALLKDPHGNNVAQSNAVDVTWQAVVATAVTLDTVPAGTRDVPAGAAVTLRAALAGGAQLQPGETLIIQTMGGVAVGPPCHPGDTCSQSVEHEQSEAGTYGYQAVYKSAQGTTLSTSPELDIRWTAFSIQNAHAMNTQAPYGPSPYPAAQITFSLNQPLDTADTGYTVVTVESDANNNATGHLAPTSCNSTTCQVSPNPPGAGIFYYFVEILNRQGQYVEHTSGIGIAFWTLQLTVDQNSVSVGMQVTLTVTGNFLIAPDKGVIQSSNGTTASCSPTDSNQCQFTATDDTAETVGYKAFVVDSNNITLPDSGQTLAVTWSGTTSRWSITSFTASDQHPPFEGTVILTAVTNQDTTNTNFKIVIVDASNGYVYEQCTSGQECQVDVPFTDVGGGTGCQAQGSGTCTYEAYVAMKGTNTSVSNTPTVSVTWDSGLRVAHVSSAPASALRPLPDKPASGIRPRSWLLGKPHVYLQSVLLHSANGERRSGRISPDRRACL